MDIRTALFSVLIVALAGAIGAASLALGAAVAVLLVWQLHEGSAA